jgi:hypothetical protein
VTKGNKAIAKTRSEAALSHSELPTPVQGNNDSMNVAAPEWLRQVATVLETLNQGAIVNDNDEERRIIFANAIFLELIV